jgi:hypothetical protein
MCFFKLRINAVIFAIGVLAAIFPLRAMADEYKIFSLGNTSPFSEIYGLASSGDVVLQVLGSNCVPPKGGFCYAITSQGMITSYSATVPALDYDNGDGCNHPPIYLLGDPPRYVCNNGRVVLNSELGEYALYTGPDPVDGPAPFSDLMKLYVGPPIARLWINAAGDIAFTDGHENFEAYDLTSHAPEPSTWMLLATGAVGVLGMVRRRMLPGSNN